jgi:hypothetical protein
MNKKHPKACSMCTDFDQYPAPLFRHLRLCRSCRLDYPYCVKDDRLTEQQHLEVCEALRRHEVRVARVQKSSNDCMLVKKQSAGDLL